MAGKVSFAGGVFRNASRCVLLAAVLCLPVKGLSAPGCSVVRHPAPTEADRAMLAADFARAAGLYHAGLAAHPGDADLTVGLVHALLRQQKLQEAAEAVKASLAAAPSSSALLTLRGEVEFRQGRPWSAGETALEAEKLDPCNSRVHMLLARIERINSRDAASRKEILVAHQLDPADAEIRAAWIGTLPTKQKIAELEAYLSVPSGSDAEAVRRWRMVLENLKKQEAAPRRACHLASPATSAEIPFVKLMWDAERVRGFGLEVKLNGATSRLQIDTGAGGLTVSRAVADRAGLKAFLPTEAGGVGDQGARPGAFASADSIQIGKLKFQDCQVKVLDGRSLPPDVDGLIGMDVFSQFLVTLDYPKRKLLLGPLPPRPGEMASAASALTTGDAEQEDAVQNAAASKLGAGSYDRWIAPEMKDYTPVYRVGHALLLPATLNGKTRKLFMLDTGAWTTIISPEAAREVTTLRPDDLYHPTGLNGAVGKAYSAGEVTFRFANVSQKLKDVLSIDTARISQRSGMEIAGFLGANTLEQLILRIDYRDGLVKFDSGAKREH